MNPLLRGGFFSRVPNVRKILKSVNKIAILFNTSILNAKMVYIHFALTILSLKCFCYFVTTNSIIYEAPYG